MWDCGPALDTPVTHCETEKLLFGARFVSGVVTLVVLGVVFVVLASNGEAVSTTVLVTVIGGFSSPGL